MILYETRKCILLLSWPRQNAPSHTTFWNQFQSFLLKIFLISYSSRPYTQNHSASKAESYMKLRLEGLSRKLHPCISTKVLLCFKFHKLNHPHNSNKRDFRTAYRWLVCIESTQLTQEKVNLYSEKKEAPRLVNLIPVLLETKFGKFFQI